MEYTWSDLEQEFNKLIRRLQQTEDIFFTGIKELTWEQFKQLKSPATVLADIQAMNKKFEESEKRRAQENEKRRAARK